MNVVKFESSQSDSAPRRRRGGRRVVRGVGAAGASLELKVEEHAATPLFEEPKLPVAQPVHGVGDDAVSSDDGDSDGVSRPSRRVVVRPSSTMMFVRLPMSSRHILVAAARCRSRMSVMRIVLVVAVVPLKMRMSMARCLVVAVAVPSMIPAMRNRMKNVR